MQSEKLFEKIKGIVLRDNADSDDWNPEKVWLEIEKKKDRKPGWFWSYGVAACLILGIGISFIFLFGADDQVVVERVSRSAVVFKGERLGVRFQAKSTKIPVFKLIPGREGNHPDAVVPVGDMGSEGYAIQENDSIQKDTSFRVLASSLLAFGLPKDSVKGVTNEPSEKPFKSEKVLIAEIELPNERAEEAPSLRRMFETAKRERESRKMRVNFGAHRKKMALWSFVQHSFIENSAHPDSGFLLKKHIKF